MATMNETPFDGQSLTRTLITALSCSDDLIRSLDQLRRENDTLKLQVDRLRQAPTISTQAEHDTVVDKLRLENQALKSQIASLRQAPEVSSQVGHLFKQNAEKQAEIDSLKSKLRALQSQKRKWRLLNPDFSSPILSSADADRLSRSPQRTSPNTIGPTQHANAEQGGCARKRPRTQSPNPKSPLCEISVNLPEGGGDAKVQSKLSTGKPSLKGSDAVDTVAEDGEDYNLLSGPPIESKVSPKLNVSAHNRLQNLLTAPPPSLQLLRRSNSIGSTGSARQPTQFLPAKPVILSGPEDAEPFRSRPLNRQGLSHFKLNPQYYDGLNYAFNETVRNQEARKCLPGCTKPACCGDKFKAIAATLPRGAMELSDDELLLEFLGAGSETKIQSLTPVARNNLIHEARAKKMANAFGKMHRNASDRPKTPPAFWGVDVLGSQEERKSHEQGRLLEREEVEKRYQEAMKENGRWLFADE